MDFCDILHCKLCQSSFDSQIRKPLILKCGHTFCEVCLKDLFCSEKILCPTDSIISEFDDFQKISVNYLILEAYEESLKNKKLFEKTCPVHKTQIIRFFCQTHKVLLCQDCLISEHMGNIHNVVPSENIVLIEPLKQSVESLLGKVKEDMEKIKIRIKESSEEQQKTENELKFMKKGIEDLIEKNYNEIIAKKQKEFEIETQKIVKFSDKICFLQEKALEIQEFIQKVPSNLAYATSSDASLLEKLKSFESFLLENQDFFITLPNPKIFLPFLEPPLLSKEEMNELIRTQIPTYDKKNRKLLNFLKEEGVLKSDLVFQTMMVINRRNFLPENMMNRAYQDNPLSIGWNTTISAPHMHAQTLEELKGHLKKGGKAIDIGCGSGYMTAAMAEIMGENSKVIGLDHIEDVVNFAKNNLSKRNQYLLDSQRVEFVKADGRKGYPEQGPYDIIHIGGAMQSVPQEILNQMAKGGRMWVPVGPAGCQAIVIFDKDMSGTVKSQKLFNVSYGMLTSVENQLQQQMF